MSARYLNRELSWVEFNARVLAEASNPRVPLLERAKFLAIVSTNFDEFFMVRIATLKRQIEKAVASSCPTGMSAREQLEAVSHRVHELTDTLYATLLNDILPGLAQAGITRVIRDRWNDEQRTFVQRYVREHVFPVLTPVRANPARMPSIGNLALHAAILLEPRKDDADHGDGELRLALVQIPDSLDRLVLLPADDGATIAFSFLEQLVISESHELFPGYRVIEQCLFRVTRDADFGVDEERDEDFLEAMEEVLESREESPVVRLQINGGSERLREMLTTAFGLAERDVYATADPIELRNLMELATIDGFPELHDEPWRTGLVPIDEEVSMFDAVRERDLLLSHPYESFEPIIRLLDEAADDPATLAIKMTLYRTSGTSPIIDALERAAQAGKQVSVLVELKARFDEGRNIHWAQRLERAGVIVVHGIARLKVHAKALMIVRREEHGVRRYVHLGTGNYNERTARLYTDVGLLSARRDLAVEVGLFFNAITGYSVIPGLKKLLMAPVSLKRRVIELIDREGERAAATGTGAITVKINSLADPDVIEALYRASQAGVVVRLNVRGICMLVPGVPGLSETITVVSVIDRYLEHTRAFIFENGGAEDVYISSADWMTRNLEKRVELMVPVEDRDLKRRLRESLEIYFEDNTKAHVLNPDGTWTRRVPESGADEVRAQEVEYLRTRARVTADTPENRQEFRVRRKA